MKRLLLTILFFCAPLTAMQDGWQHAGLRYLHKAIGMAPDSLPHTVQQQAQHAVKTFDGQLPADNTHVLHRAVRLFAKKVKAIFTSYGEAQRKRTNIHQFLPRAQEQLQHAARGTNATVAPFMKSMKEVLPFTVRTRKRNWGTWLKRGMGIAGIVALILAIMKRKQIGASLRARGLRALAGSPKKAETPRDAVAAARQGVARGIIAAAQPGKPKAEVAPPAPRDTVTEQLEADAVAAVAERAGLPITGASHAPAAVRQVGDAALKRVAGTELHAEGTGARAAEAVARAVQHAAEAPPAPAPVEPARPHDPAVVAAATDAAVAVVNRATGTPLRREDIADAASPLDATARTAAIVAQDVITRPASPSPTQSAPPTFTPETKRRFATLLRTFARKKLRREVAAHDDVSAQATAVKDAAIAAGIEAVAGDRALQSHTTHDRLEEAVLHRVADTLAARAAAPPAPERSLAVHQARERVARAAIGDKVVDAARSVVGASLPEQRTARDEAVAAQEAARVAAQKRAQAEQVRARLAAIAAQEPPAVEPHTQMRMYERGESTPRMTSRQRLRPQSALATITEVDEPAGAEGDEEDDQAPAALAVTVPAPQPVIDTQEEAIREDRARRLSRFRQHIAHKEEEKAAAAAAEAAQAERSAAAARAQAEAESAAEAARRAEEEAAEELRKAQQKEDDARGFLARWGLTTPAASKELLAPHYETVASYKEILRQAHAAKHAGNLDRARRLTAELAAMEADHHAALAAIKAELARNPAQPTKRAARVATQAVTGAAHVARTILDAPARAALQVVESAPPVLDEAPPEIPGGLPPAVLAQIAAQEEQARREAEEQARARTVLSEAQRRHEDLTAQRRQMVKDNKADRAIVKNPIGWSNPLGYTEAARTAARERIDARKAELIELAEEIKVLNGQLAEERTAFPPVQPRGLGPHIEEPD